MAIKSSFVDYVVSDLLGEIEGVRARAMFGGYGIYQNDIIFAIIVDDELYYKADDSNRLEYKNYGSKPFQYSAKGAKKITMSYWKLPSQIMDNRDQLKKWTEKSIQASIQSKRRS